MPALGRGLNFLDTYITIAMSAVQQQYNAVD